MDKLKDKIKKGNNKLEEFVETSSYCKLWIIIILEFTCFLFLIYVFFAFIKINIRTILNRKFGKKI